MSALGASAPALFKSNSNEEREVKPPAETKGL